MRTWFEAVSGRRAVICLILLALGLAAMAQGTELKVDSGDTSWMLISTALVMLMTPGLALFYSGMVRRKNVLGTMMQSMMALAVVSIQWVLIGYTLAFGPSVGGVIGALNWAGLHGVGQLPNGDYAKTIPHLLFMAFQMMFAVITPALIFGAVAERMKFKAFLLFLVLWATLVYDPLAHWVWGHGGWLAGQGALDFAGGLVVHISAGITALIAALMIGKRRGYPDEPMPPHNLSLTVIGAALLWFGWFGFNAGSALGANGLATAAFVATNTATAAAVLGWVFVEWMMHGKPTILGAVSGAVAGLVAITPAAGYVEPWAAIIIGLAAGTVCYGAVNLRFKLGYDDSLDAFGVHGVGGMLGAILTGVFATKLVNPGGNDGLLYGNPKQLAIQLLSVLTTVVFVGVASFILLKVTDLLVGLRMSKGDEVEGMDLSEHGESGYNLGDIPIGHGGHATTFPMTSSLATSPSSILHASPDA